MEAASKTPASERIINGNPVSQSQWDAANIRGDFSTVRGGAPDTLSAKITQAVAAFHAKTHFVFR